VAGMSAPRPAIGVGWTGASGLPYGVRLVEVLLGAGRDVHLTASDATAQTAPVELDEPLETVIARLQAAGPGRLRVWGRTEFTAPLASGSARGGPFVVIPCSMGTAARIVAGTSGTLLLRAADVCLKERRPHLARLSALGALVLPAAPGFYHRPRTAADLVDFIVQRVCDHLGVDVDLAPRWGDPA